MAVRIKEVVKLVGNGCTEPMLAYLEDSTLVVFKRRQNIEGNKVLANEFISYNIAIKLGLPIPEAGCALIDERTIVPDSVLEECECTLEEFYGLGFYSVYREKVTLLTVPSQLKNIVNSADIPRIILFDHLIANFDRNQGNLILDMKKGDKHLHIIDHTHVFALGAIWDDSQLSRLRYENDVTLNKIYEYNRFIYDILIEHHSNKPGPFRSEVERVQSILSEVEFVDIIKSVPEDWRITNEESDELCRYLTYRLNELPLMLELFNKEVDKNE